MSVYKPKEFGSEIAERNSRDNQPQEGARGTRPQKETQQESSAIHLNKSPPLSYRLYRVTFELMSPIVYLDPEIPVREVSGSAIAGMFFNTLWALKGSEIKRNQDNLKLFSIITGKDFDAPVSVPPSPIPQNVASPLSFRTTFIDEGQIEDINRVKIEPSIKSAKDSMLVMGKALFSEKDQKLRFQIRFSVDGILHEVSYPQGWFDLLDEWICAVLGAWKGQFAAFGPWGTSGYGWARLVEAETWTPIRLPQWEKKEEVGVCGIFWSNSEWISLFNRLTESHRLKEFTISISLPVNDEWGMETLHIGSALEKNDNQLNFLRLGGQCALTGTSLRGAFGSFITKLPQVSDLIKAKTDPQTLWVDLCGWDNVENKMPGDRKGALWFPCMRTDDVPVLIMRHAEDEFIRGVYEGSLFGEERLMPGAKFSGTLYVEPDKENLFRALLPHLQAGSDLRLIEVGAGACHPEIKIEERDHAMAH